MAVKIKSAHKDDKGFLTISSTEVFNKITQSLNKSGITPPSSRGDLYVVSSANIKHIRTLISTVLKDKCFVAVVRNKDLPLAILVPEEQIPKDYPCAYTTTRLKVMGKLTSICLALGDHCAKITNRNNTTYAYLFNFNQDTHDYLTPTDTGSSTPPQADIYKLIDLQNDLLSNQNEMLKRMFLRFDQIDNVQDKLIEELCHLESLPKKLDDHFAYTEVLINGMSELCQSKA